MHPLPKPRSLWQSYGKGVVKGSGRGVVAAAVQGKPETLPRIPVWAYRFPLLFGPNGRPGQAIKLLPSAVPVSAGGYLIVFSCAGGMEVPPPPLQSVSSGAGFSFR